MLKNTYLQHLYYIKKKKTKNNYTILRKKKKAIWMQKKIRSDNQVKSNQMIWNGEVNIKEIA